MLCLAVTPTSRTLAKVDLLNAARRADLVELCLDHLSRDPDVGDLLSACPKPVIVSCRRRDAGGHYDGAEENRLGLLRQAVIAGPAYVELDPEAAAKLPRFGETKRLLAYHSPDKPLKKIAEAVTRAKETYDADAVKFTWPTPHLAAMWPLVYAISKDLPLPVVGQGVGDGGTTFSLLALRRGAPWVYAALEAGMEDVPGQPTVEALETTFAAREILEFGREARFVAFAGFPRELPATDAETEFDEVKTDGGVTLAGVCGAWNAAAEAAGAPHRALPLAVGKFGHLGEMLPAIRVSAAVLGPGLSEEARAGWDAFASAGSGPSPRADGSAVDLVLPTNDGWRGRSTARSAVVEALAAACGGTLERRQVTLLGAGPGSEALGRGLTERGAQLAVADPDDAAAARLAQSLDARGLQWRAIYSTRTDVLIRGGTRGTGPGPVPIGEGPQAYNPSGLEPRLTVADLSAVWADTAFTRAARRHACTVVEPAAVRDAVLKGVLGAVSGSGGAT